MTKQKPTRDLRFEPDFSAARFEDGSVVKFTRLERKALAFFHEFAGRILTRGQILDAVSELGSEKSDRSIDFLINRIRSKLGDVAQAPRFIGTQYGEGYVWLYSTQRVKTDLSQTFAVIGPIKGAESLDDTFLSATEIARLLQADLRALLQPGQEVAIVPELTSDQRISGPALSVQLGFFRDHKGMECIVTTRSGQGDRIIDVQRFALSSGPRELVALSEQSRIVVRRFLSNYWRDATSGAAVAKPLPVAINDETMQMSENWSWTEADTRLRIMRAEHPDDPAIKLMWATHLHAKYVKHGAKLFRTGTATCAKDEAEIERLVLESLDFVRGRPGYAVTAAKLLYFVNQGYRDLALELTREANMADTSLTSTLAIMGQLLGFTGDMEAAEDCLVQAVRLSGDKIIEQSYALYMLIQAYTAAGDRDKQASTLKRLYQLHPALVMVFDLYFTDPVTPSLRARAMTLILKRAQATAMLRNAAYVSARLYSDPRHRENSLRPPVNLFVKRFGHSVVPDDVAIHLPGLLHPSES